MRRSRKHRYLKIDESPLVCCIWRGALCQMKTLLMHSRIDHSDLCLGLKQLLRRSKLSGGNGYHIAFTRSSNDRSAVSPSATTGPSAQEVAHELY
jgi:hypothetical protein